MTPFGSLLIGTIAEHAGVRVACAVSGGAGLVAIAVAGARRLAPPSPYSRRAQSLPAMGIAA